MSHATATPKRAAGTVAAKPGRSRTAALPARNAEAQEAADLMRSIDEKLARLIADADAMLRRMGVTHGD